MRNRNAGGVPLGQAAHVKGRAAQVNPPNPYVANSYVTEFVEGLDEPLYTAEKTEFILERPKKIVNKVDSPDIPLPYSMNPYQGCEHGCIYCYARNTHQYWGLSAGLDFEQKIIVKENAPELLAKAFDNPRWRPQPIMLAGNTDCYQPVERERKITRRMLEVMLKYKNPVGVITKNSLVLRDLDILAEMAAHNLVRVAISITTLEEELRRKMEPRTATGAQRLKAIELLSGAGVPVTVMVAPVIPGLNNYEIIPILQESAARGAVSAAYTMVRLNGPIADIFKQWIREAFPNKADKVLHQIAEIHGGKLGEKRFGKRMRGEGEMAESIREVFRLGKRRFFKNRELPAYNLDAFDRPSPHGQMSLF